MSACKGTYALLLACHSAASLQVGRWGLLHTLPGNYIYVGSAFGPGGLESRLSRHFRSDKSRHWHIDHLTGLLPALWAWVSCDSSPLEHHWARALSGRQAFTPIRGFGCSDCRCGAHLFHTANNLTETDFSAITGNRVGVWKPGSDSPAAPREIPHQREK